ncbi:alpha/beta hydrolase [Ralstonia sp. TCR112]|uniref:alpha/beta hydrolase n=1 Tax=Ralstonia sp. TCR112 TaxID=2601730 RepID=UPI0021C257A1|nr:alpha/beta hydrolase [Ralstonia sp. TCR112]
MAHGLGGVKEMRLDAFAERFSDAGYACLVFDYRNFGASEGAPRQLLDIGQQLEDWSSAIAFARLQPSLMRSKIVLWGTSFGGGHVIASAARDQNVAAAIAQCPFTDGIASALAMDLRSSFKVTAMAMVDMLRGLVGMTPLMVATSGPPHSAALMTAPDAHGGYLALVPSGVSFRNHVAARFALNILRYRPGRARQRCPARFCSASARPTPSRPPAQPGAMPKRRRAAKSVCIGLAISTSTSAKPSNGWWLTSSIFSSAMSP